jgi:hypothetical protein
MILMITIYLVNLLKNAGGFNEDYIYNICILAFFDSVCTG